MTTPYYTDERAVLHHGDCLDVLAAMPDASVDAIVEGFRSIGIEREADYLPLIEQRIARACPPLDFTEATA